MRIHASHLSLIAFTLSFGAATAQAADPSGTYLRDTGASKVRISKCGEAYCGSLVWLKDPNGPAKVGQRDREAALHGVEALAHGPQFAGIEALEAD